MAIIAALVLSALMFCGLTWFVVAAARALAPMPTFELEPEPPMVELEVIGDRLVAHGPRGTKSIAIPSGRLTAGEVLMAIETLIGDVE